MSYKNDYYEILEVSRNAQDIDIEETFYRQLKKYYSKPNDKEAEQNFTKVIEAYEILSDINKRADYDRAVSEANTIGLYGGFDGINSRNRVSIGNNIYIVIYITSQEALYGVTKEVQLNLLGECNRCNGTGSKNLTDAENCKHCNGTGVEKVTRQTMYGTTTNYKHCTVCGGYGKIINNPCPECYGKGKLKQLRNINIEIPKGVVDGQKICLQGKGEFTENRKSSTDLFVYVAI